ncbi:MAG: hypothetical protein ACI8P0_004227 [Planctomycetaceae bacterium]
MINSQRNSTEKIGQQVNGKPRMNAPDTNAISPALIEDVCTRLAKGERVRQKLPGNGLLSVDRLLPFLVVYRRTAERQDDGTDSFVRGEASFMTVPGNAPVRKGLRRLIRRLAETAHAKFGAFLIVELWAAPDSDVPQQTHPETGEALLPGPQFTIHTRAAKRPGPSVNQLIFALEQIRIHRQAAEVNVNLQSVVHPPKLRQLLPRDEGLKLNCFTVGLEILPIYRCVKTGAVFPDVLRQLQHGIGPALRKAFFTFSLKRTNTQPGHWFALGRSHLPKIVTDVDAQLAEVDRQFGFLLQVTPINAATAWQEFEAGGYSTEPTFLYRPLVSDPLLLKRQVNSVPTEKIVDAALAHVFRQTQDEIDRMLTMLSDLGTPRFLLGSQQVFGFVDAPLLELAEQMLQLQLPVNADSDADAPQLSAAEFAQYARSEIRRYRRKCPGFDAKAQIRDNMYSGLMVSSGNLLIGRESSIAETRVEALLAHEVGTHLVTRYNGGTQPLRAIATGLAGYDSLQEGLAVLSEYLVGGLSVDRLRTLAARVVAVHMMTARSTFVDTWHRLVDDYCIDPRSAWTVTMRVYRGGGLTKDAVYLRGLVEILEFLKNGGDINVLFIGKLAVEHVPIIQELLHRDILKPAPLTPHYMQHPLADERMKQVRAGIAVLALFPH